MVGEESIVELGQHRNLVRVLVDLAQVLAMLVERAGLVPALRDARIVLPLVEELQVLLVGVVERPDGEELVQVRDVAAVDHRARRGLGRPHWVHGVHAHVGELGREGVLDRVQGVCRQRPAQAAVDAVVGDPDGARSKGRARALPEGAAVDEQLV